MYLSGMAHTPLEYWIYNDTINDGFYYYNYYNEPILTILMVDLLCIASLSIIIGLLSYLFYYEYYINRISKNLVIIRGLPGSGKSSLNKSDGTLVSIDDKVQENNITFRQAHVESLMECMELIQQGHNNIYIESIFNNKWEYEPFYKLGNNFGILTMATLSFIIFGFIALGFN